MEVPEKPSFFGGGVPVILDFDRPVLVGLPRLSHMQGAMISGRALFEAR